MADFEVTLAEAITPPQVTKKVFKDQVTIQARLSDRRVLAVELINAETEKPIVLTIDDLLPNLTMAQASIDAVTNTVINNLNEKGEFVYAQGEEPMRALKAISNELIQTGDK